MFLSILNQMIFLFGFILIGYILSKMKFVPENASGVLSKLENMIFVPALVMGTFIKNFNIATLQVAWKPLVVGFALVLLLIPLSLLCAKLTCKEKFLRKVATYALAFSNFAYMGNAIMSAVFPDIFSEYIIFTLPFWFMIYLWGVPVLLIGSDTEQKGIAARLKSFVNPMFIGMLIGIVVGLIIGWIEKPLPTAVMSIIDGAGSCMSPIAMLLTGMTIGKLDLLALMKRWQIYAVSAFKLLVYPLLFIGVFALIPQNAFLDTKMLTCALCVMAMPTGLNTIVIPAGYGKDTTDAAGLALVSHLLSVGTIPLMFWLFQTIVL